MMDYKRAYRITAVLIFGLVVTILVASLALAKRDASVYPGSLYAGPIQLGSLTRADALQKLQEDSVVDSLTVTCITSHSNYPLKLRDLGIQLDAEATISKIDSTIENWSLLDHSIHRGKKQVMAPVWEYDVTKLRQSLSNLALSNQRDAVDARLILHGDRLLHYPEQQGAQIDAELAFSILTSLLNEGQFKVVLPEKEIAPAVPRHALSSVQDLLSVQAVPAGGECPENNDAGWAVPGKLILPGKSVYVNIMIDISLENGAEMIGQWHQALARAASEAGLLYNVAEQQLRNPSEAPVALFINREKDQWLIRIYGKCRETGKMITLSRTYEPLLGSAGDMSGEGGKMYPQIYRHEFWDNQLHTTEVSGQGSLAAIAHSADNTVNDEMNPYK